MGAFKATLEGRLGEETEKVYKKVKPDESDWKAVHIVKWSVRERHQKKEGPYEVGLTSSRGSKVRPRVWEGQQWMYDALNAEDEVRWDEESDKDHKNCKAGEVRLKNIRWS